MPETAISLIYKYYLIDKCSVHFSVVFDKIKMQTILKTLLQFLKQNKINGVRLKPKIHKII